MADPESSFSAHAGQVRFPRSAADLTSISQCPACFSPLSRGVCLSCGLDLNHPAAMELAATSASVAALLGDRREIIGRIRFETARAIEQARVAKLAAEEAQTAAAFAAYEKTLADAAAAAPTTVAASVVDFSLYIPAAQPDVVRPAASTASEPSSVTTPIPVVRRLRGSSIQVLLLIAGVSLVSLAAVLFIIYAFVNFGIEWRSAIIASVTVATFTVASLLRRRGYTATAEGIGVFAVVLVYLDAYAVRANNLFGSDGSDPQVYWGVTLLGSALGFILWHRLSALRVASVAGFAAVAPGAALLLYGLAAPLDQPLRLFLSFAAMAIAGLLHPLAARGGRGETSASAGVPERSIVLGIAAVGMLVALGSAFLIDTSFWGATLAVAGVAVIGAAHALVALTPGSVELRVVTGFGRGFAAVGAVAAGSALAATLLHQPQPDFAMIVPPVAAVVVALGLDTLWRRLGSAAARGIAGVATIGALVVAAAAVVIPLLFAAWLSLFTVSEATSRSWGRAAGDPLSAPVIESSSAVVAVAIMAVLAIGFSAASRTLGRRLVALVAIAGTAALLAVPLLGVALAIVAGWFAIGAIALALVILSASRWQFGPGLRVTLTAAAVTGTGFGYLASWASVDTWLAGSFVTIALVLSARLALPPESTAPRAALLGASTLLGIIAAIALAHQVTLDLPGTAEYANSVRFVDILVVGLLALGSVAHRIRLTPTDRRTIFWIGYPVAVVTSIAAWLVGDTATLVLPEFGTSLVVSAVLLVALVLWVVLRDNAQLRGERMAASVALAPVGFLVVDAFARLTELPGFADISSVTSALLVAAGALVVSILRPSGTPRWTREIGIALVVTPALFIAVVWPHNQTWLVLILGGVTMLLTAISTDGLFGSDSGRKHFGWLALALGTTGLWWRLATGTVDDVEAYVLPVAGALLSIAVLVWRTQRGRTLLEGGAAAPAIALGGLLVAVLPIAAAGATGTLVRAIVIACVSAALLLGGSLVRGGTRAQPYLDAAATAGTLGLLTVTIGRIALSIPLTDGRVDAWLGGAGAVLFAAAAGQAFRRDSIRLRLIVAQSLAGTAIATALVVQLVTLTTVSVIVSDLSRLRVLGWAIAFAVVAIAALTVNRGPLRPTVGWISVGAVGLLVFSSLLERTLTIVEASGLLVVLALASSAVALAVTLLNGSTVPRQQREIGLATLGLLSLVLLAGERADDAWALLEIAAIGALLVSISPDGLFGATSPRKHIGWLALSLAFGGMWWRLAGSDVRDVEPYVLPLAGALLVIALLVWRFRSPQSDGADAPPVIALGALLIAILPLGLAGATGPIARPIAVGLASAALLILGSVVVGPLRLRPYLNAAAAAGAVGVLVVAIGRVWFIAAEAGTPDASLDAWLGATLAVLIAAAFGQARPRDAEAGSQRSAVAQALGIAGLTVVLIFEATTFDNSTVGFTRALVTVLVFCIVHVVAVAVDVTPFTRLVAWTAFGLAAITAGFGLGSSALDEIEYASVPLAIALIAGGMLHLRRDPSARSWPHLGPGLLVLLAPSLLSAIDDRPIWRVAAIAIVAIAMTVVGLVMRSQATFVIGALVTVIHTVTTLWPQLSELYELHSWLVWIAIGTIGGTLLIVLAARFEKSLNTARSTLRRVGELR